MRKLFFVLIIALSACTPKKTDQVVEPTPKSKERVVLLIGDSHMTMAFGARLESVLSAKRYGISSATATTWARDTIKNGVYKWGYATPDKVSEKMLPDDFPGAARLIKQWSPDIVIIELGTNDADNYCQSGNVDGIRALLEQAAGTKKCAWIGPPQYNRSCQNSYIDKMADLIGKSKCVYIDSRRIKVKANTSDKVHFTGEQAETWAATVFAMLLSEGIIE